MLGWWLPFELESAIHLLLLLLLYFVCIAPFSWLVYIEWLPSGDLLWEDRISVWSRNRLARSFKKCIWCSFFSWIKTRDLCTGIFESLYRKRGLSSNNVSLIFPFLFFYGFLVESLKSKTASFILSWQRSFFLRWSNNSSGCSYIRVILSDWLV